VRLEPTPLCSLVQRERSVTFYESNRLLLPVTSKMPPLIKSSAAISTKGETPPVSGSSPLFILEPGEAEALPPPLDGPAAKATIASLEELALRG
jgi:hypothetical protein